MRWSKLLVIPVLAIGFASPAHADDTDQTFVDTIIDHGIDVPQATKQAKAICMVLDDSGETFTEAVKSMVGYNAQQGTDLSLSDAAFFAGAAIGAYCPRHIGLVRQAAG